MTANTNMNNRNEIKDDIKQKTNNSNIISYNKKNDKNEIKDEKTNTNAIYFNSFSKKEEENEMKEKPNNIYISPYQKYKKEKKFDKNQEVLEKNNDTIDNNINDKKLITNNIYLNNKNIKRDESKKEK